MFWNKRKNPNEVYIPFTGSVYTQNPLQVNIVQNNTNQVSRLLFQKEINLTSVYVRVLPTSSTVYVYGDQFGGAAITNTVNAIGLVSASAVVGTPTINQCINALALNQSGASHYFFNEPWRTRNLYFQGSLSGTYTLTISYIFV